MLTQEKTMLVGVSEDLELCLVPRMGNRHGLITGATGTGKTVTLQTLAEGFSALGVPVLLTDIKGDLAGISQKGNPVGGIAERIATLDLQRKGYANQSFPTCFWEVGASGRGHPLRTTVSDMGPLLLGRLLNLNDIQSGVLNMVFRIADEQGLLLLDFKDLRSMVGWVGDNRKDLTTEYGNIASATVGAIQRALLQLEDEGAEDLFGEPCLRMEDLLLNDLNGRGVINILTADKLMLKPRLYASVLLWLLSELYEQMPEQGDQDKPRLVLMFDEAHLLFSDMPPVLLEKVEQVVRLIRSRGVGVYFITQSPADIPESVLAQLGNRVQHALRAYTPRDRKALKAAADSFRPNPKFDTEEAISTLRTGEALVSLLDVKGAPSVVERALIVPPQSSLGAISDTQRAEILAASRLAGRYDTEIDRESAYEKLTLRVEAKLETERNVAAQRDAEKDAIAAAKHAPQLQKNAERQQKEAERQQKANEREAQQHAKQKAKEEADSDIIGGIFRDVTRQAKRTVTNSIGREIGKTLIRGILGGLFGGKK